MYYGGRWAIQEGGRQGGGGHVEFLTRTEMLVEDIQMQIFTLGDDGNDDGNRSDKGRIAVAENNGG